MIVGMALPMRWLLAVLVLAGSVMDSGAQTEGVNQQARLLLTVSDADNNLLSGVRIRIVDWITGKLVANLQSDDNGFASIRVTASHGYVISTSLAGYHSEPVSPLAPPGDLYVPLKMVVLLSPVPDEVTENLPASGRSAFIGYVRSTSGRPLPGITVEAIPVPPTTLIGGRAQTRADGSYRMDLPSGNYIVRASGRQGFVASEMLSGSSEISYEPVESQPVFALVGQAATVNLQMTPRERLFKVTVVVLDDLGRTVPGASVEWHGSRETNPRSTFSGKRETDASGALSLGAVSPGPLTMFGTVARGDGVDLVGDLSIEVGNSPLEVTMRLLPGPRVVGRVEFTDGRAPLHGGHGLRVSLQRPGAKTSWFTSNDPGLMNPDGRFSLGPVSGEGCLRVRGIPEGWRLREIDHQGRDVKDRLLQFHWNEIYDLVVRIEPGVDEWQYEVPECKATSP